MASEVGPDDSRWGWLGCAVEVVACVSFGLAWGWLAVVGGAASDGVAPADYDAGNRFALGMAFVMASAGYPIVFLTAHFVARFREKSLFVSFLMANAVSGLLAVPVFVALAGRKLPG